MIEAEMQAAREDWQQTIRGDGGVCPCCDRWGKVYGRYINASQTKGLAWLCKVNLAAGLGEWIDVPASAPKELLRSNEISKLRWWGLVERKPLEEGVTEKRRSGMWRITQKGVDFVEGKVLVPKKAFTYNDELLYMSEELTDFASCSDDNFDYSELMATSVNGSVVQ